MLSCSCDLVLSIWFGNIDYLERIRVSGEADLRRRSIRKCLHTSYVILLSSCKIYMTNYEVENLGADKRRVR
jgi:hypothetical protein